MAELSTTNVTPIRFFTRVYSYVRLKIRKYYGFMSKTFYILLKNTTGESRQAPSHGDRVRWWFLSVVSRHGVIDLRQTFMLVLSLNAFWQWEHLKGFPSTWVLSCRRQLVLKELECESSRSMDVGKNAKKWVNTVEETSYLSMSLQTNY